MEGGAFVEYFKDLDDPREDNKRHNLTDIVVLTICAVICGADKWEDIETFGKAKESWLKRFLDLPHGIPSHDTISRVFAALDAEQLNQCFLRWIKAWNVSKNQKLINIDGKTLRHSYDSTEGKSAIHMISAWASEAGITLGQLKVDEKSNEIPAIPQFLDLLDIEGSVITIDAKGTQKEIARTIIERGADYVLAIKGNQGTLNDDVELYFQDAVENEFNIAEFDYEKTVDKDHGRIEIREYWVTSEIEWLESKPEWKGLQSICMVKSTRTIGEEQTTETRFYIYSLPPEAKRVGEAIRSHWGIENSLHWVLDMAFREDGCRKRKDNAAENFSVLRRIALNLLKQEKTCKRSIAGKRLLAGWDNGYLEKVLFSS